MESIVNLQNAGQHINFRRFSPWDYKTNFTISIIHITMVIRKVRGMKKPTC